MNTPMSDEYTELERLANLCLPGPWRIADQLTANDRVWPTIESLSEPWKNSGYEGLRSICHVSGSTTQNKQTLAKYLAKCSPEVILKLVQKARVQTQLVEALEDANRWLRFQLDTHIEHREPKGYRSGTVTGTDGWAVVAIPDWDVRQRLDVLEAALAAAKETL